jgi:Cu/Zn superoxide dismutase
MPALAALCGVLIGCSSENTPDEGAGGTGGSTAGSSGSAGMMAGTSGAGAGGSAGGGGGAGSGGTAGSSAGSSAGGSAGNSGAGQAGLGGGGAGGSAGNSGGSSGTSGSAGAGGAAAGAAGTAGGGTSGSSGGGAGGAGGEPTAGSGGSGGEEGGAIAMLMPTSGNQVSGTAIFTQDGEDVVLTITLTDCPPGDHASHIHEFKDCGDNGNAAGNHWVPEGEVIDDITCESDGTGMLVVTPPTGTWTIGEGDNDVTQFALMLHSGSSANPGGRIACGEINVFAAGVHTPR